MTKKTPAAYRVPAAARPDWRVRWADMKHTAAKDANTWMLRNPGCRVFLYYEPNQGSTWGKFYLVPEMETEQQPPGVIPASPETIPPRNIPGILQWIDTFADRLPMLGGDQD